jgi:hypothetical protein
MILGGNVIGNVVINNNFKFWDRIRTSVQNLWRSQRQHTATMISVLRERKRRAWRGFVQLRSIQGSKHAGRSRPRASALGPASRTPFPHCLGHTEEGLLVCIGGVEHQSIT